MIQVRCIANDRSALLREIQAFLAAELGPAPARAAGRVGDASRQLVRFLLERIPPHRVGRRVLRDWALASSEGRVPLFSDLVKRHAGGDGRRWAGHSQSITKAPTLAAGRSPIATRSSTVRR
jgi:hypothetical protein